MPVLTSPTPTRPPARPRHESWFRHAAVGALGAVALLLTVFTAWVAMDFLTHEYVDAEVLVMQVAIGASGLLSLYAWTGVILMLRPARDPSRRHPALVAGLVAAPICAVAATVAPPPLALVAVGLAVVAVVVALVEAFRR